MKDGDDVSWRKRARISGSANAVLQHVFRNAGGKEVGSPHGWCKNQCPSFYYRRRWKRNNSTGSAALADPRRMGASRPHRGENEVGCAALTDYSGPLTQPPPHISKSCRPPGCQPARQAKFCFYSLARTVWRIIWPKCPRRSTRARESVGGMICHMPATLLSWP